MLSGSYNVGCPFPLKDHFFRKLVVDEKAVDSYLALSEQMVERALMLEGMKNSNLVTWKTVSSKFNTQQYEGKKKCHEHSNFFKGIHEVDVAMEKLGEVYGYLSKSTSNGRFRSMMEQLYTKYYLDAQVLQVLKQTDTQTVCIKWLAVEVPSLLVRPRDICYLEVTGVAKDAHGVEFAYLAMESIEVPECPPMFEEFTLVRAKVSSMAYIFRHSDSCPGSLIVTHTGNMQDAGPNKTAHGVAQKLIAMQMHTLQEWKVMLETSMLEEGYNRSKRFVDGITQVSGNQCCVCAKGFSILRKKLDCEFCDLHVCKKCSLVKRIHDKKLKYNVNVRVCKRCLLMRVRASSTSSCSKSSISDSNRATVSSRSTKMSDDFNDISSYSSTDHSNQDEHEINLDYINYSSSSNNGTSYPNSVDSTIFESNDRNVELAQLANRFHAISEQSKVTHSMVKYNTSMEIGDEARIVELDENGRPECDQQEQDWRDSLSSIGDTIKEQSRLLQAIAQGTPPK